MARSTLEVADIVRAHGMDYVRSRDGQVPSAHQRVLRDIVACRTKELGGHVERCDHCGNQQISYNSCRNRHCPKCQAKARAKWMAERQRDLLPVEYFHVVFTLPREMAAIARQNPTTIYNILFRAASDTLLQIARDPRHLDADIGFLAVLHTWGQNLDHHPHVHCVVPGGGLSPDRSRWIACPAGFFLSVNVLSRVFCGKFIDLLKRARRRGKLTFQGDLASLADDDDAFNGYVTASCREQWVVYSKPPFGGPEQVLKYLARYTHRVAISNSRLVSLEGGKVTFRWKDYADHSRKKLMTLDAVEFIRRFLLHVVPSGFVRIRHCGILANRVREANLARCRELLNATRPAAASPDGATDGSPRRCDACGKGVMVIIERFEKPALAVLLAANAPPFDDTS